MTLNTAIYKVESGAAKKRKKIKEQEDWNSKNGPVIIRKINKWHMISLDKNGLADAGHVAQSFMLLQRVPT